MGSLNILPTNGVNLLSFVSQKLPPKLHKITALVIAILAVDVAVRYAFYSRTINASEFEPFSNKCASLEEVINLLKDANSFLMRGSLEALNPTIKKIHETSQELSNNKSLNPFEITIEKSPLPGLTTRLLQHLFFLCLTPH